MMSVCRGSRRSPPVGGEGRPPPSAQYAYANPRANTLNFSFLKISIKGQ